MFTMDNDNLDSDDLYNEDGFRKWGTYDIGHIDTFDEGVELANDATGLNFFTKKLSNGKFELLADVDQKNLHCMRFEANMSRWWIELFAYKPSLLKLFD